MITNYDPSQPHSLSVTKFCRSLKVFTLNHGPAAARRDSSRGQIGVPNRGRGRREVTSFRGDHYGECYVVKNEVVVARDRILVPIKPE